MYLRLGQPTKPYKAPFTKGGQPVGEKDRQALLTVLAGPSPYQNYIQPVMATQGSALPANFFRIVTNVRTQVPAALRGLFRSSGGKLVAGTVDRWTRTIYMIQAPGLRNATRLEYALHEAVHLFAHPVIPQQGCPAICIGTFQRTYGVGFGEGATQAITEAIMAEQRITLYYRDRPYEEFTEPVRKLISIFPIDLFARAYFWGNVAPFTMAMQLRWGQGWMQVAGYTTMREPKKALQEITKLETAYKKRPVGDFPTPSRTIMLA